jgi:hypothetical protein
MTQPSAAVLRPKHTEHKESPGNGTGAEEASNAVGSMPMASLPNALTGLAVPAGASVPSRLGNGEAAALPPRADSAGTPDGGWRLILSSQ